MKCALKRAEIEAARIEVANLDLDVQQSEVRAPLSGVVTSAEMNVGDVLEPGKPVVEIADAAAFSSRPTSIARRSPTSLSG